jgi:hypothetical protein
MLCSGHGVTAHPFPEPQIRPNKFGLLPNVEWQSCAPREATSMSTPRPLPMELSSAVHQSRLHLFRRLDETLRHNS